MPEAYAPHRLSQNLESWTAQDKQISDLDFLDFLRIAVSSENTKR